MWTLMLDGVCGRAVDCQKTFPRSASYCPTVTVAARTSRQASHSRSQLQRAQHHIVLWAFCSFTHRHRQLQPTITRNEKRRIEKIYLKPTPRELSFLFVFLDARGLVVGVRCDDDCALHDGCHGQELLRQETARERAAGRLQVFCIKRITSEASSARCSKCSKTGDEWVWKPVIALGFPTYKMTE